jgi:hypothetical protein
MPTPEQEATFERLRSILENYAGHLVLVDDTDDHYYLDTAAKQANGKPIFFGSVRIGKQYVAYHLMPVYIWPELLDGISPELRRRMQGKSCFNFKQPDPALLNELSTLTRRAYERCRKEGQIG